MYIGINACSVTPATPSVLGLGRPANLASFNLQKKNPLSHTYNFPVRLCDRMCIEIKATTTLNNADSERKP